MKTVSKFTTKNRWVFRRILLVFILFSVFDISWSQTEIHLNNSVDYMKKANKQYENGDWEGGKSTVEEGLKKYRIDSDLKMLLGKYYRHKKNYERARYELVKALSINPDNVEAKQLLVNVEMEDKRYSSAICYVNELLEVNPYWRGLWRKKIQLYELQGNNIEANRLRKRINQIYPEDAELKKDYLYNSELEAAENRKKGNIDKSIEISKTLLMEDPQNVDYYLNLINDLLKAGDGYNALSYTERGLKQFPNNTQLVDKKAGILAEEERYDELLPFLLKHRMTQQYDYYLLVAARSAREKEPSTRYGKIFESDTKNVEAFNYVFNYAVGNQQYEEALYILNRHRLAVGESKELYLKELMVYQRMGNIKRADALIKELFVLYPQDEDLKDAYVRLMFESAKTKMSNELYEDALLDWYEVLQYGDEELEKIARNSIFNVYLELKRDDQALSILNDIILYNPDNKLLYLKRVDIYLKQKKYHRAVTAYEQILAQCSEDEKERYIDGYSEMLLQIVKNLNEENKFFEAKKYVDRWLEYDPTNQLALHYAVNLSYQLKQDESRLRFAQRGGELYPDDMFFKIKLAEIYGKDTANYKKVYNNLHSELVVHPYHEGLINTFSQHTENYGLHLIKEDKSDTAIVKIDTALVYDPKNNSLKYLKGVAYEKLKEYDSAYYYQSFYVPSYLEEKSFQQQLYYLKFKSYKNQVGIYHLRSRFGDRYTISTLSTFEYSRFSGKNVYTGRVNYAGRDNGRGFQVQAEWVRYWDEKITTNINFAVANKFFPSIAMNASVYKRFDQLKDIEFELGVGYRKLDDTLEKPLITFNNMLNLVVGATLEKDHFTLNGRLNNFLLDKKSLFNFTLKSNYYFSTYKNFVTAMAGIGSSPDIELINYQLYDGFSVLNVMVGAGYGRLLGKNVYLGALGTWYNYEYIEGSYRNLYNISLNLNVAF